MKKPYEKPAIVYSADMTCRAIVCAKADSSCDMGPIMS